MRIVTSRMRLEPKTQSWFVDPCMLIKLMRTAHRPHLGSTLSRESPRPFGVVRAQLPSFVTPCGTQQWTSRNRSMN